jgi:hypothetical protein
MSDQSRSGRNDTEASKATMMKWLGFFLLVFAVAGLAFYITGDGRDVTGGIDRPMTQGAR